VVRSLECALVPFQSKAQQRFLEAHPEKVGGKSKLKEWEGATDFKSLPERKQPKKSHSWMKRQRGKES
jgi:hypothetical protein